MKKLQYLRNGRPGNMGLSLITKSQVDRVARQSEREQEKQVKETSHMILCNSGAYNGLMSDEGKLCTARARHTARKAFGAEERCVC